MRGEGKKQGKGKEKGGQGRSPSLGLGPDLIHLLCAQGLAQVLKKVEDDECFIVYLTML